MSNQDLQEGDVLSFLTSSNTAPTNESSDPLTETKMEVTLDQLQSYLHNPRRTVNPQHDDIRESIERVGLDRKLEVSRRLAGDKRFTISGGGNTRLAILHELHKKYTELAGRASGEEKRALLAKADTFFRVEVVFKPWGSDTVAIAAHARENELRGQTKFIERALTVKNLHQLYLEEDELEVGEGTLAAVRKPYTVRELSSRITNEGGWPVTPSHISRYQYTTGVLLEYIPNALWAGAGEPMVRRIRQLYKVYLTFWNEQDQDSKEDLSIDDLFYSTLREHDGAVVDIDGCMEQMDLELGSRLGISSVNVEAEIRALLFGSKPAGREADQQAGASGANVGTPNESGQMAQDLVDTEAAANGAGGDASGRVAGGKKRRGKQPSAAAEPGRLRLSIGDLVLELADTVPGGVAVLVYDETTKKHERFINANSLFSVLSFMATETKAGREPVYGESDLKAVVVWQLVKFGNHGLFGKRGQKYTALIEGYFASYLEALREVGSDYGMVETVLWLEQTLFKYPQVSSMCSQLQSLLLSLCELADSAEVRDEH